MGIKEEYKKFTGQLKKKRMTKKDKVLDEFCKEIWHCTIFPGGIANANKKTYELYRGHEIVSENYVRVVSQDEIMQDNEFKEWYANREKSKSNPS